MPSRYRRSTRLCGCRLHLFDTDEDDPELRRGRPLGLGFFRSISSSDSLDAEDAGDGGAEFSEPEETELRKLAWGSLRQPGAHGTVPSSDVPAVTEANTGVGAPRLAAGSESEIGVVAAQELMSSGGTEAVGQAVSK